jgi:hypothetical protein
MEQIENNFTPVMDVEDDIIFTRYLYVKRQVLNSLFISILEHNRDESLFWGYELYYSGFQQEVIEFLLTIYIDIFSSCCNENFTKFYKKLYENWQLDNTKDYILGVMIWNLCIRKYNINKFMEEFLGVKCSEKPAFINKTFRITMMNIDNYKTHKHIYQKGRFVLKERGKYKIRDNVNELFNINITDTKTKFHYHWLYYAYESPIWKQRIIENNGRKNNDSKEIEFDDDDMDNFYELYAYEPDEQSLAVQEIFIGNSYTKQLSIKEFSEKYGGTMICKFIKQNK